MSQHKLVICEKPSVAQGIAAVLGAKQRGDGYLTGNGYILSWCCGHLAELESGDAYDSRYARWRHSDLPILPDKEKQLDLLRGLTGSKDTISLWLSFPFLKYSY